MISKMDREMVKRLKELERRRKVQERSFELDEDPILRELVNLIEFKITEFFDEHCTIKPLVDQPEYIQNAIDDVQFRFRRTGKYDDAGRPIITVSCRFKTPDKLKTLELLGKHVGAFIE